MAAPTPTVRSAPGGRKLGDGYQSLVTFALDPDFAIWEEEVTPPGIDGGDAVDTTSQHNENWKTKAPGSLVEMTDASVKCNYDPVVYVQALALVNKSTVVTVLFPDGSTLAAYGYLKSAVPGGLSRNNKPEMTLTIVFTNQDPVTCEEEGPVYTAGSGTSRIC